jgi:hypothetical protein
MSCETTLIAFAWCLAGLATAFGLNFAIDTGSRPRAERG